MLAFAYILLTVIVALEVPLALTLQRRGLAEAEAQSLAQAQTMAAILGSTIADRDPEDLAERFQRVVERSIETIGGRIIVVDEGGALIADSAGTALLGRDYATPGRPEILAALGLDGGVDRPATDVRFSETLGQDILATAVPVFVEGRPEGGAVRISTGLEQVRRNVQRTILGLVAVGGAGLVAGLIIAWFVARSLARPLARLQGAAHRLGAGDLSARTEGIRGAREIEEVAESFDEMASRLEAVVRSQREFVANASHQLRTPLTGMKLRIESALADPALPSGLRQGLEAADGEVDRLSEVVERLLVLAREVETGEGEAVDVGAAVAEAVDRWRGRAEEAGASLDVAGEGGTAAAAAGDLAQVLDNLIDNAISYAPGPITVRSGPEDGWVVVRVRDRGAGIAPDEIDRVTERFFRGRGAPPGGSGLGLAIVRDLAERWAGRVRVAAADGGGTVVEVRLPSAPRGSGGPATGPDRQGSGPRVRA
ncbi:MAG: HAMP domain-containing protein [Actinobacteria bacterium]|nr:HAMP domain-containing protein [Actinomycetota bacterium]